MPPAEPVTDVLGLTVAYGESAGDRRLLRILSNGQIFVPLYDAMLETQISREALQALIDWMVQEQGFLSLSWTTIKADLRRPPPGANGALPIPPHEDGLGSFITLTVPDCSHSVVVRDSAMISTGRPDVEALQRFRAIELRLLEIVTRLQTR
ncbi:hypothetical protein ACN2XU_18005 [Primorskyibacter sp. 2E107]